MLRPVLRKASRLRPPLLQRYASTSVVAAVVQAAPVFMDTRATAAKASELIGDAAALGASIVAFPESFMPAFPYGAWHHGVKRNMAFFRSLFCLAASCHMLSRNL